MHLPSGKKIVITLSVIAAVFGLLGTSSAVADTRPKVTVVATHFELTETGRRTTTCQGQDGTYEEVRQTWQGMSTQTLPAGETTLTGTLIVRSKLLRKVILGFTVSGTFSGTAFVVNGITHKVTAAGKFLGVTNGAAAGGVYQALVTGDPNATNGKLIGNFDITMANDLTSLIGTLGGTGMAEHPAVVVQGACEHDADDTREEVD